ncbi:MAG: ferrochelatase, partial [Sphingomonadales bacterium]
WLPILYGPVLTFRPKKSAHAYAAIWNEAKGDSPLRVITQEQAEAVAAQVKSDHIIVEWAMRYGNPSMVDKMEALKTKGCERILVFALYPQYSATTTASVYDKAFDVLQEQRWQQAIRTMPSYHDHPAYIDALSRSVNEHLATLSWEPDVVLASFHGLPKRNLELGDPYYCQCQKTGRLLREKLGWDEDKLRITFQSRFGRAEWLKPYTETTVKGLAAQGKKRIAVICPGFSADCLETLEEIAIGIKATFLEAGGEAFHYIPCLNSDEDHIAMLTALIKNELQGWI